MPPLLPNPTDALRFSRHLHHDAPTECRLIHPVAYHVISLWGTTETLQPRLASLNAEGYGVFILVNTPYMEVQGRIGVGKSTRDQDIVAVTALFVELDRKESTPGENLAALRNAPLPPTLIVRSSKANKLHAYWRVRGIGLGEFKAVQAALIARFQGDPACKNLARVMRLPGYHHTKSTPLMTTILELSDRHYSREEMFIAFPELPKALEREGRREARAQSAPRASRWDSKHSAGKHNRPYALAALQNEHDKMAYAAEGTRNTTLNTAAFSLGQLARLGLLSEDEVVEALSAAALACGLDEAETSRTIASGFRAGFQSPRGAPLDRPSRPPSKRARLARWYR